MNEPRFPDVRIHPSALIEEDVHLGEATAVWDGVHIRRGARIGRSCIIGEKTYIAYDVRIGDGCKLNASVYVCAGVSIGDDCMLAAHVAFTNDLYPRAFDRQPGTLASSEPTEETLETRVGRGVTIGANATIGPGLELGDFCMVAMGAVVTRDVPAHALVMGNPARVAGWVCTCGPRIATLEDWNAATEETRFSCERCGRVFGQGDGACVERGRVDDAR